MTKLEICERRAQEGENMIDTEAIREHIRGILVALGDDPDREGLKETPDRVARMYEEVFEGITQIMKLPRCLTKHLMKMRVVQRTVTIW